MAGVTNQVFRLFAHRFGASVVYSEMISALGIRYGSGRTDEMMRIHPEEGPVCIQIFGADVEAMGEAAKRAEAHGAAYIDINMACPVPKVTKGGAGSAHLMDQDLAVKILHAVIEAINIPVTVKLRSSVTATDRLGLELGVRLACEGASALALHPRTVKSRYSGQADWSLLKELVESVDVPVWGSGDLFTAEAGMKMLKETGCAGIMFARGAMGNPWIFRQAVDLYEGRVPTSPTWQEKLSVSREFVVAMAEFAGQDRSVGVCRKHLLWLFKGVPGGHELKNRVTEAESVEELLAMLDSAADHVKIYEV